MKCTSASEMIRKLRADIFLLYSATQRFASSLSWRTENPLKNICKPEEIPTNYWTQVLWIAMDLKKTVVEKEKTRLNLLNNRHVTLLFGKPHGRFQVAFTRACDLLGAGKTIYQDPYFENQINPADSSKVLSRLTDMFIVHGVHHDILVKVLSKATVPVFSASCNVYNIQKVLSDLMTFQEKFDYLKGLSLAWLGPPTAVFNAYYLLCPQFNILIKYVCFCIYGSGRMSPIQKLLKSKFESADTHTECKSSEETVTGADIIATSMHPEENQKINLKLLENANKKWYFLHTLPRTSSEVSDDVFDHPNNLSWDTSENYLYVAMAVILTNLGVYKPGTPMPDFHASTRNP